jgi:hypothetical protein
MFPDSSAWVGKKYSSRYYRVAKITALTTLQFGSRLRRKNSTLQVFQKLTLYGLLDPELTFYSDGARIILNCHMNNQM